MTWTSEPPTEPGLYLWRLNKDFLPDLVFLTCDTYGYFGKPGAMETTYHTDNFYQNKLAENIGGQWAGPIPEPEDA